MTDKRIIALLTILAVISSCKKDGEEIPDRVKPEPTPAVSEYNDLGIELRKDGDPYDTYRGLVMAGYQGWFGTPGDGSPMTAVPNQGWYHYRESEQFRPGVLRNSIDFWPDMSEYEKKYGVKYSVEFTYQDKATDTIAVDVKNRPFRTEKDDLLFRPAGHGALIYNLNKVDAEIVSIKNIDNVSNERLLPITAKWKKVLLGKCLELRDTIFGYLEAFDKETDPTSASCRNLCNEVEAFLDRTLCIQLPLTPRPADRVELLRSKLNRPIRVCGMVKNEGEPGGGPFIIAGKDGSSNLQILESVQINITDPRSKEILSGATHFNPVDLVCCLRNYKGEKFDLLKYVDEDAGFISSKSYQGRELKALELPGLWNGAMSDWNTLFVEVPLETFNPVKVVLDLLRPAHQ